MHNRNKITAVIKAKNEQNQIAKAIESALTIADQVLVIDDNSTDATASIAELLGARVMRGVEHFGQIDKLDYQGFTQVSEGWILRMDADERMTPELCEVLKNMSMREDVSGVKYARKYYMFGDFVHFGGWLRSDTLGFFRADKWDKNWECNLHSQVPVFGRIETISSKQGCMIHLDYDRLETFIHRTLRGYAFVEATEKVNNGMRFNIFRLFMKPSKKFIGRFFVRAGFRDGSRGLVVAILLALYEVLIELYMWDITVNRKRAHK